ncbi:MAG: hypothetical protein ACTHN5_20400 [Phycisphaerae bacterium]
MTLTPPAPAVPPAGPHRSRFPRFSRRAWLAFSAGFLVLLLLILYLLARSTPSWYQPLDPTANDVIDDADVAQNKLRLELHNTMERVPLGEQEWKITEHQINSLLAIRFTPAPPPPQPDAAKDKSPQPPIASSPFVRFSPGKITVAARSPRIPGSDPAGGVLSVTFVVESTFGPDGAPMGVIRIDSAAIGNLPIPKSVIESKLKALTPTLAAVAKETITYQLGVRDTAVLMPQIETAIRAVSEGQPFPLRFRYDRRDILIREVRVEDGVLIIHFAPPNLPGLPPH